MSALLTFITAFRDGALWARVAAVIMAAILLVALAGVMIYRHDQRVLAEAEAKRVREGIERNIASDAEAEKARRMTEQERCLIVARQSGMAEGICAR